ncbi:MAG: hypothetical protein KDB80_16930 [Planctomycetes bacterium]|nr:hypothetical protein [Planctomycetota bacterium]
MPPTFDAPPPGTPYGPAAPIWEYRHPEPGMFHSFIISNAIRLPNGNTLACSGTQGGLMLEVDPAGNIVWNLKPDVVPDFPGMTFRVDYTERRLWADSNEVSLSSGGEVRFNLCAGSDSADKLYFIFGSASGTSPGVNFDGHQLLLNPDDYFITTIFTANQYPYNRTAGVLDGCGCGWGTFTMPGGIIPTTAAGVELNHGFVVFDSGANAVTKSSNSEPMTWQF